MSVTIEELTEWGIELDAKLDEAYDNGETVNNAIERAVDFANLEISRTAGSEQALVFILKVGYILGQRNIPLTEKDYDTSVPL